VIFANKTAAEVWKEHHCDRCFQPEQVEQRQTGRGRGCPILYRALVNATPPAEIVKGRSDLMASAFRCTAFTDKPASTRRATAELAEEPPLFEMDLFDGRSLMDTDHA
jgi:hypothetical protein